MGLAWIERESLKRSLADRQFMLNDLRQRDDITALVLTLEMKRLHEIAELNGLNTKELPVEVM